jgi:hypothetical protein
MPRKRTRTMALLLVLVTGTLAVGLARAVPVAGQDDADAQTKIDSAMRAGRQTVVAEPG